jgi:hypothetical protein
MFHLRDDVLCWFWFLDYFKNQRTVSSGSLSKKSESKNYWSRLFQKPEKDWQFSGKNQPFMASGSMAGYLKKKIQTKIENHGYIQDSGPRFLRITLPIPKNRSDNRQGSFPVSNKHQTLRVYLLYLTLELRQEIYPRPLVFRGVSSCKSLGNNTSASLGFKGWCNLRAKSTDL